MRDFASIKNFFVTSIVPHHQKFSQPRVYPYSQRSGTFGKLMEEFGEFIATLIKERPMQEKIEEFGDVMFSLLYLGLDEFDGSKEDMLASISIGAEYGVEERENIIFSRSAGIEMVTRAYSHLMRTCCENTKEYRCSVFSQASNPLDSALAYAFGNTINFGLFEGIDINQAMKIVAEKNAKKISGETPTRLSDDGTVIRL